MVEFEKKYQPQARIYPENNRFGFKMLKIIKDIVLPGKLQLENL